MYELAKRLVCSIIAVVLSTTVTIVEGLLPLNPQWLERVAHVAAQLRAIGRGGATSDVGTNGHVADQGAAPELPSDETGEVHQDLQRILAAYQQLWDFVQGLKANGLALDDEFLEKVEREWSVSTLLSYLRSADKTLQDGASEAQSAAARFLVPLGPKDGGEA